MKRSSFWNLLHRLGLWHFYRWGFDLNGSPVLRILSCHRAINPTTPRATGDREDLARGCLSLVEFEERIRFIARHYCVASLESCVEALRHGKRIMRGSVVFTFDDGFTDVHENVYPLMREKRLPFTVFLTTAWIGTSPVALTPAQIAEMAADPLVSWGAHGVTHRPLTQLSLFEAEREVVESRRAVESWTGRAVHFFAYPDGHTNPQIRALLIKHNFWAACVTGREVNRRNFDLLALQRIPLTREPMSRFVFRLAGLSDNWRQSLKKDGKP